MWTMDLILSPPHPPRSLCNAGVTKGPESSLKAANEDFPNGEEASFAGAPLVPAPSSEHVRAGSWQGGLEHDPPLA